MAIEIIKGKIKVGNDYLGAGTFTSDLSIAEEEQLITEGMAVRVLEDEVGEPDYGNADFETMTLPQLTEFAAQSEIDISGLKKKDDIIAAISKWIIANGEDDDA